MLALVLPSLARFCMAMKLGIAIAARMPMITTTIMSSINVKPLLLLRRMAGYFLLPRVRWRKPGAHCEHPQRPCQGPEVGGLGGRSGATAMRPARGEAARRAPRM